ncbi:hypothetical protein GW7_08097 [Heterocephalus glaber]|uniref:Uncharacterized protein n=1 Tax=Heterocephalus glaber TaxID=10181 RepID=G5C5W0_HETGA|nr:hypothetical protein GW7_08097 [Heterocephalus glaber]
MTTSAAGPHIPTVRADSHPLPGAPPKGKVKPHKKVWVLDLPRSLRTTQRNVVHHDWLGVHKELPISTLCQTVIDPKGQGPCNIQGHLLVTPVGLWCDQGQVAGFLSFTSLTCEDVFKPPVVTALARYVS